KRHAAIDPCDCGSPVASAKAGWALGASDLHRLALHLSFIVYAPLFSALFFGVDRFQLCPVAIRRSLLARSLRHFCAVGAISDARSRRCDGRWCAVWNLHTKLFGPDFFLAPAPAQLGAGVVR